jgi:uncharacterized protein
MLLYPERWKNLEQRYTPTRPRKILSLDGGGIRGLITVGILERIEDLLRTASGTGDAFRLCDYFDYIGGTSTGAILAAGLARGLSVSQLRDFYLDSGEEMFKQSRLLDRFKSFHTADPLRQKLQQVFGATTDLSPEHLRTLLLIVTKNSSTDSAWPISSNPAARYNDPARADCNAKIPLWQLIRASTAAPVFFPPEVMEWDPKDRSKSFVFVDGGVTAYNNPAFLLHRLATEPAYALEWQPGERNLLIVSLGTGSAPTTSSDAAPFIPAAALSTLTHVMDGAHIDQDMNCRTIGRCTTGPFLDREVLDLVPRQGPDAGTLDERLARPRVPLAQDLGRRFLYARYDATLTRKGLHDLGIDGNPDELKKMNNAERANMHNLLAVGRSVAKSISLADFGSAFQPGA